MNIRQLETFVTVADYKSFTRASEVLYLTQPTVSNHISSLEEELDTILFIRDRRNISLTKSGEIFYNHAQNILATYNLMTEDLITVNSLKGQLKIKSSSIPRVHLLPKILSGFSEEYPEINFSITNQDSRAVIDSVHIGETDFGFVGSIEEADGLEYLEVMKDELVMVIKAGQQIKVNENGKVEPEDLLKEDLIIREVGSGTRKKLEEELVKNSQNLRQSRIRATAEDWPTIFSLVKEGFGVSIVSDFEVEKYRDEVDIYKIEGLDLTRSFYFVYKESLQYMPINKTFKKYVMDQNFDI